MRVEDSQNMIIIYLFSDQYTDIKKLLINIFKDLNKYYGMVFRNSYILNLYINEYYGMILEIKEDDLVPINRNIINLNLNIINNSLFLYEIDEPLNFLDYEMYYYNDKFFINIKNFKVDITIFDDVKIVYGDEAYKVIGKGIKI